MAKRTKAKKNRLTQTDWAMIFAKAWREPEFRKMLETNPTKAIKAYGEEHGRTFDKIISLRDKHLSEVEDYPPSCC